MLSLIFALSLPLFAAEPHPSPRARGVEGTRGMVVSDDREASEWGAQMLREGGTAADAAVAAAFTLAVTRPHFAGLGGGGFMLYCPDGGECEVLDYRETAPAAAKPDMYLKDGKPTSLSVDGPLAAGVPGVVAGLLAAHDLYGKLPLARLMQRPIELAKNGFRMTGYAEEAALSRWAAFSSSAKRVFGCGRLPCAAGTLVKQPELARVLEEVSARGRAGFYGGWVAQKLAGGVRASGGILTEADLRAYAVKRRKPLRHVLSTSSYRDLEIVTMPPPSAGGTILIQLLRYAELASKGGAFAEGYGSVKALHAAAHALSLGFADRSKHFGDPDFVSVPVEELTSRGYLDLRWEDTYRLNRANIPASAGEPESEGIQTTHFSVLDAAGNAASVTTTLNNDYGSGFMPPGTGVILNDEMDDFTTAWSGNLFGLVTGKANVIAPGKRPLSSMSPTIVRENGEVRLVLGAMGGPRIISAVFQVLLAHYWFWVPLADAVHAPRIHQQWNPKTLHLEPGFSPETRASLSAMGWDVRQTGQSLAEGAVNQMHCLQRTSAGRVIGVADPRAEGAAAGE
jgi:gamma-glutamyltranspeptidase/glutathione hydrolase